MFTAVGSFSTFRTRGCKSPKSWGKGRAGPEVHFRNHLAQTSRQQKGQHDEDKRALNTNVRRHHDRALSLPDVLFFFFSFFFTGVPTIHAASAAAILRLDKVVSHCKTNMFLKACLCKLLNEMLNFFSPWICWLRSHWNDVLFLNTRVHTILGIAKCTLT